MNSDNADYDGHDLEALSVLDNYHDWIVDLFAPHIRGAAIEYGAGIGANSRRIRPLVESLELIEPSLRQFNELCAHFGGDAAITVRQAALEDHIATVPDHSYDSVVLINVLEHIADDGMAVRELARILKPSGTLLLFVPALPFLFSRMDTILGHYRRYRRDELGELILANGFEIIKARYVDALGTIPWWLVNTLGGAVKFNPVLARLYDRLGVPLTRFVESLLPATPFGKNIVVIARKNT